MKHFKDIRVWIILLFLLRIYGITNPPLETGHNWRQSLTCMIARNFYQEGPDLLHPKIDMDGKKSGVIGSEFPIFNFGIYIIAKCFGYAHWYGRLLNLVVSCIGTYYFFRLLEKYFKPPIAFNATIILLVSIWFSFSRKIMPDTFSVSLVIVGLYYVSEYFHSNAMKHLLLFVLFSTIGILCKLPSVFLLSLLLVAYIHPFTTKKQLYNVGIGTAIIVAIVSSWYFYYVPLIVANGGFQLYFPKTLTEGFNELAIHMPGLFEKFYFSALNSYVGFACFLLGIIMVAKSGNKYLGFALVAASVVFGIFIVKTGAVFPLHNYYIIPFVPIMALVAAIGISHVPKKYSYLLVIAVCIEGVANQQHDFFIKKSEKYKTSLEAILNANTKKSELIQINGGQSPQLMYFANRKGWTINSDQVAEVGVVEENANAGASFLVIDKHKFNEMIPRLNLIFDNADFSIYKLSKTESQNSYSIE